MSRRSRIKQQVVLLRGLLDGLDRGLELPGPLGAMTGQAIVEAGTRIATWIAIHDAFEHAEREKPLPPSYRRGQGVRYRGTPGVVEDVVRSQPERVVIVFQDGSRASATPDSDLLKPDE
jgi:hypothetical protein